MAIRDSHRLKVDSYPPDPAVVISCAVRAIIHNILGYQKEVQAR
jgi:hypothetical protein